MIDRRIERPAAYRQHGCLLVRYRLPMLPYCFVLCRDGQLEDGVVTETRLLAFFLEEARRLALESVGDAEAFVTVMSGAAIRRRPDLHMHVFIVRHRWEKAWVYTVLGAKNAALALWNLRAPLLRWRRTR